LALVTILLNGKGQRIGDIAAGTTVISEKKTTNFSQTLWMEIPEGYLPKYPQVVIFKDAEMQTIKNIYQNARVNGNHNIILKLAAKTAGVMEIQFEENPIHFIDTVIKDYNYFTQQL
ncbi:MAG: RDD family protein, partial [Flavobacteriales bacterium]|nr:RDD family protein [Flavobacteriales bacterium]